MTFNTSTTIEEQIDYIKKYGLLIQFKKLTVFQCVALIALLINFLLIYNRVVGKMKVVYPFYESVIIKKPKKVNV